MRKGYTEIKMAKGAGGEKGLQTKAQIQMIENAPDSKLSSQV